MSVLTCDYTFYVYTGVDLTEVFPLNFLDTSLIDELEKNHVFYRRKFNGTLIFGGQKRKTDFDYFWTIEQAATCDRIYIAIMKGADIYWEGYFSTSDGAFDLDACTFTVTPLPDDQFALWLDKGDNEYNMITMPTGDVPWITTEVTRGTTTWSYTRNKFILDVLGYIVDDILPGTTVVSTFLTDATNPVTLSDNRMLYLTIAQKYDIKYPTSTTPATVAMVSFNSIMKILECLNLRWTFDGTDIIVEHVSYAGFPPLAGGIDIRTQELAEASNKYRYIKESMPKYEKFSFMESNVYFIGQPIWYDSDCVNQDSETNISEFSFEVTTDIEYIEDCMADPDRESNISDDGFVLLCNREDTESYYVQVASVPTVTGYIAFNGDLSWPSLHEYYFRHGRILITGYINGSIETFFTAKKTKQQEVSIVKRDEFDPEEEITTELGETYLGGAKGMVGRSDISPSGLIKLNLLYGPEDNITTANDPPKTIKLIEVADVAGTSSTFYATLSEPATDNGGGKITIKIKLSCKDAGNNLCDTALTDLDITTGEYTGSCVVDWCEDSICVDSYYDVDMSEAPGWEPVYIIPDPDSAC